MIHELGASFLKLGVPFERKFSQAKFEQEFFRRNENQTKALLQKDFCEIEKPERRTNVGEIIVLVSY